MSDKKTEPATDEQIAKWLGFIDAELQPTRAEGEEIDRRCWALRLRHAIARIDAGLMRIAELESAVKDESYNRRKSLAVAKAKADVVDSAGKGFEVLTNRIAELEAEVANRQGGNATAWSDLKQRLADAEALLSKMVITKTLQRVDLQLEAWRDAEAYLAARGK